MARTILWAAISPFRGPGFLRTLHYDPSSLAALHGMVHTFHLLFDYVQFTLIHGPNIPGSYAVLFFATSDFTFTTRHIHNLALFLLWPSLIILYGVILYSPVAYWTPSNMGGSSGVIPFGLFILFMGLSRQEYWYGLPFPPPVGHILSEPSTVTYLS